MNYTEFTYETLTNKTPNNKILICLRCGEGKDICECNPIIKLLQSKLTKKYYV